MCATGLVLGVYNNKARFGPKSPFVHLFREHLRLAAGWPDEFPGAHPDHPVYEPSDTFPQEWLRRAPWAHVVEAPVDSRSPNVRAYVESHPDSGLSFPPVEWIAVVNPPDQRNPSKAGVIPDWIEKAVRIYSEVYDPVAVTVADALYRLMVEKGCERVALSNVAGQAAIRARVMAGVRLFSEACETASGTIVLYEGTKHNTYLFARQLYLLFLKQRPYIFPKRGTRYGHYGPGLKGQLLSER